MKATASFLGWQETPDGYLALFNIESGPKRGTTTTEAGLKREGIEVPKLALLHVKEAKNENKEILKGTLRSS